MKRVQRTEQMRPSREKQRMFTRPTQQRTGHGQSPRLTVTTTHDGSHGQPSKVEDASGAVFFKGLAELNVAPVSMVQAANKDVLLIERFDRIHTDNHWHRKLMVSALTLLGLDEMMARYASYEDLAEIIRHHFKNASTTLKELFSRLVFNILCGNTDDHARNHAAFWDGKMLELTPAYDICPQGRTGNEATQAMLIFGNNRMSQLTTCLATAHNFLLSPEEAREIIERQIAVIKEHWKSVCDEANLNQTDRALFWKRQFLNPFAFEGF